METAPRILIVDDDAVTRHILVGYLQRAGYVTAAAADGDIALALAAEAPPSLVLLDLLLPPPDGYEVLRRLREMPATRDVPVVVLTALEGDEEVERAFGAGVDDFLRKPFREVELLARIHSQLRLRGYLIELSRKERDARVMVELTHKLASSLDFREILFTVVRRIAEVVRVERCSIVVAREAGDLGFVVAASDDARVRDLPIELDKYPEIQQVLQTLKPLTIEDAATHPMFWEVRAKISSTRFPSLTLLPIAYEDRAMGVLFLRAADGRGRLDERELSFCQIVANATAVALRNARVLQKLREESQAVTVAKSEAERRLRLLERYADLFLSSADGMAVVDLSGRILFANPRATEITGYSEDEMRRTDVRTVVTPGDTDRMNGLLEGFGRGAFPVNVDVVIRRKDAVRRTLSVSTSSLLREDNAVLLTFRDVTDDRATAAELSRTKEFLSSLIESSPDAIIAARLDGQVLLFNSAAERILGWSRDELVHKLSVEGLYPSGYARDIMRRIRGRTDRRVEGFRTEILARDGERIPILMSAAMVSENGVDVATVGIFADLRERLKMEERLATVQHRLALTEKQMLIAELAGAAAHELNQPLTAIQGYAELLQRRSEPDTPPRRTADVILGEAERMAEIVRKIGRITRYETKPYVGGASILDLDRSAAEDSKPPPAGT